MLIGSHRVGIRVEPPDVVSEFERKPEVDGLAMSAARSAGRLVGCPQEPQLRVVGHFVPLQPLLQLVGLCRQVCPFEVVSFKKDQELIWIVSVAKVPATLAAIGAARGILVPEDHLS